MTTLNKTAVEFSMNQQAFHKSKLFEVIAANIKNIKSNVETDYLLIGLFDSDDDADNFIKTYSLFFLKNS